MVDSGQRIEEIKVLLSSLDKPLAYAKLLRLQEGIDPSAVETLVAASRAIISSLVIDISDNDEEIASQALKCLGFMIYHPSIVASIGGDDAEVIIASLVKVITTTKTKSVCNLGVWCISIQQFSHSLLDHHFLSLIRAVNHALDNPMGSVSVTFEAMQAVVKLASSSTQQMRNMSSVWAPPIYRRLVSVNKRERDMSERCLLKITHVLCPPPTTLCKAIVSDMKKNLFKAMKELLDQGMKIQCLRAWGWFIRLLGSCAIKNKPLINDMLKFLEQTFSEFDPPVQIASLVAWEGLIDAVIEPGVQLFRLSDVNTTDSEDDRNLKRIKLIMAPLAGVMSSKCDVSVHASCMNTWSYLLHKLGASVSCQSVINIVWEPIIKAVFSVGPDGKNTWLWNSCLDLFENLILGRNQVALSKMSNTEIKQLVESTLEAPVKHILKHHVINYSPWNLSQLDFFLRMIFILVDLESKTTVGSELKRSTNEAALRLFVSLMETVGRNLHCDSISYGDIMQCLNTIFGFLLKLFENMSSGDCTNYNSCQTCLEFLRVVTEILGPSVLESPLYKVSLESIKSLEYSTEISYATVPGICSVEDFEGSVLPIVQLCVLYYSAVVKFSLRIPEYESQLQQMKGYLKLVVSSYNPQEVIHVFLCLLHKNTMSNSIEMWVVIVNCLQECIKDKKDLLVQMMEMNNVGYSLLLHLLLYPFASWPLSHVKLELQTVIEVWNLLYVSFDQALQQSFHCLVKSLSKDLCALLSVCIDQSTSASVTQAELQQEEKNYGTFASLCGNAIICVLKQLGCGIGSKQRHYMDCDLRKSIIKNSMGLAARFMKLFWVNKEIVKPAHLSIPSRFLLQLVNFLGCLHQSEDILVLVESISSPLLEWLSEMHLLDDNANCQLQLLWTEMLKGLERSEPSLNFNSSFLEFQQPLLEMTLDHPNPGISDATINYWNSVFGAQNKLEFPEKLLPLLDKLFRNGKIKIHNRNHYTEEGFSSGAQRCKVTTSVLRKCSKRVEIVSSGSQNMDDTHLGRKRKQLELTEHQKEVRRAQQGRTRDCSGHGPGIRTYTSADFSQGGNDESQDSPNVRDAESILEMLKKVH